MKKNKNMLSICEVCSVHDICNEPDKNEKVSCHEDIYKKWHDIAKNPCVCCVHKDTGMLDDPCWTCLGEPMYDKFELKKEENDNV